MIFPHFGETGRSYFPRLFPLNFSAFFPFLEMFLIRSIKIIFIVLLDLPADLPANSKERKNQ